MKRNGPIRHSGTNETDPRSIFAITTLHLLAFFALDSAVWGAPATQPTPTSAPASRPVLTDNVIDAKGLDYAIDKLKAPMRESDPLSPADELTRLKPKPGLAVDLIAAEPDIRQPLCINFDERGRMWVVQYIQYPFPAGLKVVEYDQYIRAKFDKVPQAPPHHVPGKDVITILEDVNHDGSFTKRKTFVSGLNICTSALPGRGGRGPDDYGVWVMNAPYLLFYPDKNRDDIPDSDPIVHLSGFGLEDTHAVANSLTWGPDGWLYGCQGSTCTAKVKTELGDTTKTTDFLGQAIWRYHPERHVFEIFAEGGGNTFGLEFDDHGNAFSGTNWGKYRGLHFVQGGYYVKGWGKHGPLTNPYAFGYFEHMPHTGNAERLSHTMVVYGGGLLGPEYTGKILSPNSLQSRLQVTRLEPVGSTFKTVEEPFLMTSDDGWFRPIDLKAGPDGALYVADMYEKRISHVDPRDTWDRTSGRLFRVRPADWKPGSPAMDLWTEPAEKLVERLKSPNRWERAMARRVLGDRHNTEIVATLRHLLLNDTGQSAVEALWTLHALGTFDERSQLLAIRHQNPTVRRWAIGLLTNELNAKVTAQVQDCLMQLAESENDLIVRSQLASSAKRMDRVSALAIVRKMAQRDADFTDPQIPLLLWWAAEAHMFMKGEPDLQFMTFLGANGRISAEVLQPRLIRRLMADPTEANILGVLSIVGTDPKHHHVLVGAIKESLAGTPTPEIKPELRSAFGEMGDVELALRFGVKRADVWAIAEIRDPNTTEIERVRLIEALGFANVQKAAPFLLLLIKGSSSKATTSASISALLRLNTPSLSGDLLDLYRSPESARDTKLLALSAMMSRQDCTKAFLEAVLNKRVAASGVSIADIERLRQSESGEIVSMVEKVFGKPVRASDAEKTKETDRIRRLVTTGAGDAASGKPLFTTRCAACHMLFDQGGKVGPDLTAYDRRNVNDMVINIVDPSAYIREEFASFRVKTKGGEVYVGLITERSADRITMIDAGQQKTTIAKADIADERALTVSLMPEGLLAGLSDQEVRDLFKYLAGTGAQPQTKR